MLTYPFGIKALAAHENAKNIAPGITNQKGQFSKRRGARIKLAAKATRTQIQISLDRFLSFTIIPLQKKTGPGSCRS